MIADRTRAGLSRLRRTARTEQWTPTGCAVVAVAGAGTLLAVASSARWYAFADLATQRDALRSWRAGGDLYSQLSAAGRLGFPLPPTAAIGQLPAAALPLAVAGWGVALAGVAALILALIALVGPVARRHGHRRWVVVTAAGTLALLIEPVRAAIGLGTLDLLIFGLVTADVVALRRRAWVLRRTLWWPGRQPRSAPATALGAGSLPPPGSVGSAEPVGPVGPQTRRQRVARTMLRVARRGWDTGGWVGVGTGLATAIGVSPVVFIGYLALTRQWRATLTAVGTALLAAGTALLLVPHETVTWLGRVLWRLDRTGAVDATANQSLAGMLARLYDSTTTPVLLWLAFASLLLAVGLIRARSAHAAGDEITAFTLVGLTGAVIAPVSNTHELIWVLPALLVLVDVAVRRRSASRLPWRRGLQDGWRPTVRPPGSGGLRQLPVVAGAAQVAAAAAVYVIFVAAPVWAYEHRLPETSHRADGLFGLLVENTYALVLIVLVATLPWRPGAAPAFPSFRWAATTARRRIPPARRPLDS